MKLDRKCEYGHWQLAQQKIAKEAAEIDTENKNYENLKKIKIDISISRSINYSLQSAS